MIRVHVNRGRGERDGRRGGEEIHTVQTSEQAVGNRPLWLYQSMLLRVQGISQVSKRVQWKR